MPEQQNGGETFLQDLDRSIKGRMAKIAEPLVDKGSINSYGLWLRAMMEVREDLRVWVAADLENAYGGSTEPDSSTLDVVDDAMRRHVREGYGDQPIDPETQAIVDSLPTTHEYINRRNAAFRPQDPEAPLGGAQ